VQLDYLVADNQGQAQLLEFVLTGSLPQDSYKVVFDPVNQKETRTQDYTLNFPASWQRVSEIVVTSLNAGVRRLESGTYTSLTSYKSGLTFMLQRDNRSWKIAFNSAGTLPVFSQESYERLLNDRKEYSGIKDTVYDSAGIVKSRTETLTRFIYNPKTGKLLYTITTVSGYDRDRLVSKKAWIESPTRNFNLEYTIDPSTHKIINTRVYQRRANGQNGRLYLIRPEAPRKAAPAKFKSPMPPGWYEVHSPQPESNHQLFAPPSFKGAYKFKSADCS
jgi:hypothetical protein